MRLAPWIIVISGACDHHPQRPAVTSCDDDLHGVWRAEDGRTWMLLDNGATLEGYPMFDDAKSPVPTELVLAPRYLDLQRDRGLAGELRRRYMRGADQCLAKAAVHVTSCSGETLELVLAEPQAPLGFSPCTWPGPAPSRRERWVRD